MAAKTAEKQKTLAETLSAMRGGKNSVQIGALDDFDMTVKGLSTGNITLDALTGVGGIPVGRISEFRGKPSSGKTTAALQTAALFQQNGGVSLFLDYERSLDPKYVRSLGVKTGDDTFLYNKPRSFEDGANRFRELLHTGELGLLIVDSVATMVTESELAAETGKATMADRAKTMHQFLRQIVGEIEETECTVIFLNHVMDLVDISPMGQRLAQQGIKRKTSPGGTALPFYSSLRVEFNQTGNLRTKEMDTLSNETVAVVRQTKTSATIIKNKVGDPFKTAELRVRFGKGFSQAFSVLEILVAHGYVARTQAGKYTFKGDLAPTAGEDESFVGEEKATAAIESNPEWLERLREAAQDVLDTAGAGALSTLTPEEIEAIKDEDAAIEAAAKGSTTDSADEDEEPKKKGKGFARDEEMDALLS